MTLIDDTVTALKKASGALNALEEQGVVDLYKAIGDKDNTKEKFPPSARPKELAQ